MRSPAALPDQEPGSAGVQRLDKWLWYARVTKTRSLATKLVSDGNVRINREKVDKPATLVRPGDVATIAIHQTVRVLKVSAPGVRRVPAEEARTLYEDLTPPIVPGDEMEAGAMPRRDAGAGRPTKKERREINSLRGRET